MKTGLLFLSLVISVLSTEAQNIGVNNTNPQTALDVEGRLRIRPAVLTVTGPSVTIPGDNKGYYTLNGTPGADFTVALPTGDAGSYLLIENITVNLATITGLTKILPGKSRLLLRGSTGWILADDSESQLEKITESGLTGWRLLGRNPNNHGNIGNDAVDLSYSAVPSSAKGATGSTSVAMGFGTMASGILSTAMGENTVASGFVSTAMGSFSIASGDFSTATGSNTTASGSNAVALGSNTIASGLSATAMGGSTLASGEFTVAMGASTYAKSYLSLAIGQYNDTIAGSSRTSWVAADPLLTIGNGVNASSLSNAMTVYKNGNTDMNGFVRLGSQSDGAPRIKVKKITTTLNASANGSVAHGLTESKILELSVKVANQFNSLVFDGNNISNNSFNAFISGGSVVIQGVAGNIGDIINRPATILITYEE